MQLKFVKKEGELLDDNKIKEFFKVVDRISGLLSAKINNKLDMEAVIGNNSELQSHLSQEFKAKPEPFTKENIIEEFMDFLGYTKEFRGMESELIQVFGRRYPDYKFVVKSDFYILVEAEPLNADLKKPGSGVNQVVEWITNKACRTDYGIATDGFRWFLIQYSLENHKHRIIKYVDLSPFFKEKIGFKSLLSDKDKGKLVKDFILFFAKDYVDKSIEKEELILDIYQEEISKKFYDEYMALLFGNHKTKTCLVNSITGINNLENQRKIAQIVIDRLIFIKFIEAKGWLNKDSKFLFNLWNAYNKNPTGSFYDSYLKMLFFNVLNNPEDSQKKGMFAGIKYLNGGLFRKIPEEKEEYSIDDDIIGKVILFLEKYTFGNEQSVGFLEENYYEKNFMSPEILGYIFERTANHQDGAYYTPSNVTGFIIQGTVHSYICDQVNIKLKDKNVHPIKRIESLFTDNNLTKKELGELFEFIKNIRVLDPGCGSGAFYMPVIGLLTKVHKLFSAELDMEFNIYKVKKWIIENNIFGVELNPEAVEIAKLRLWLELVGSVANINDVDLLPNIEYNIMCGNTLVGFSEHIAVQGLTDYLSLNIDDWIDVLGANYHDAAERIKELAEKPAIPNLIAIKDLLLQIYKNERNPKQQATLKKILEKIHVQLQAKMNEHYLTYLNPKLKKKEQVSSADLEHNIHAFHWILEFDKILSSGGFDCILGNPPYVEHSKIDYPLAHLKMVNCGNTYAPFFERAITICKNEGYFGYIVPISSVCTDRMTPLQKLLIGNTAILKISNFDDRPDKIFKGLEHCRSSIIFGLKNQSTTHKVYSTRYHRWYAIEREKLFKNIHFEEVTDLIHDGYILKLGSKIEKAILEKISSNNILKNILVEKSKDRVVFHNAPQYWIRAMNFMPEFSNAKGVKTSSHNKELFIDISVDTKEEITAILNSSLFYWFFVLRSNGRDLTAREIENFPCDVTQIKSNLKTKLRKICENLMEDYKKNSKLKHTEYKATGKVVYREFYPGKSKKIIDQVDDILAEHYGFTNEEKDYIKNFDLKFRLGGEDTS